jgi:hypothetical protein
MNKFEKIALTGAGGTTIMTASSYLMSLITDENFRENDHLETMISRLVPSLSKTANIIAGWGAHYAMGMVFAAIYVELWETQQIRHSIRNGVLLGVISGVLGYLIWKATFKLHPLPPWISFNKFYLQRIPAHIVFAVAATVTYRLTEKIKNQPG